MRSRWVSVGGAVVLAVVAVLATLFAGVVLLGGAAERSSTPAPERPASSRANTPAE